MRNKTKCMAMLIVLAFSLGLAASCSRNTAGDLNASSVSNSDAVQSSSATPTPSPIPTPTPEPRLVQMVIYYDPFVIGPKYDKDYDCSDDRKSEEKYVYMERYDAQGNVVYTSIYDPERTNLNPKPAYTTNEYEFSDDGKLIAKKYIFRNDEEYNSTYEYDEKDRLITETEVYEKNDSDYTYVHTTTISYEYDERNQLVKKSLVGIEEITTPTNEHVEMTDALEDTTYEYDEEGRVIKETHNATECRDDERVLTDNWESVSTYDDRGLLIEEKKYYNGELQGTNTYQYNDDGFLIEDIIQPGIQNFVHTYYEYSGDLLIKTTSDRYGRYYEGGKYQMDPLIHVYEYNEQGDILTETISGEGNSHDEGLDLYTLEYNVYTYNEDGLLESRQSYYAQTAYPDLTVEDLQNDDFFSNGKRLYKYYYE